MDKGLPFQTGPGVFFKHIAGQVIHEADSRREAILGALARQNGTESSSYNPYVLGETLYGSTDPQNPAAPNADLTVARTDTWDINNPPLDIGGQPTYGVTGSGVRIADTANPYETGFYLKTQDEGLNNHLWMIHQKILFRRTPTFDSTGRLVAWSEEDAGEPITHVEFFS